MSDLYTIKEFLMNSIWQNAIREGGEHTVEGQNDLSGRASNRKQCFELGQRSEGQGDFPRSDFR